MAGLAVYSTPNGVGFCVVECRKSEYAVMTCTAGIGFFPYVSTSLIAPKFCEMSMCTHAEQITPVPSDLFLCVKEVWSIFRLSLPLRQNDLGRKSLMGKVATFKMRRGIVKPNRFIPSHITGFDPSTSVSRLVYVSILYLWFAIFLTLLVALSHTPASLISTPYPRLGHQFLGRDSRRHQCTSVEVVSVLRVGKKKTGGL